MINHPKCFHAFFGHVFFSDLRSNTHDLRMFDKANQALRVERLHVWGRAAPYIYKVCIVLPSPLVRSVPAGLDAGLSAEFVARKPLENLPPRAFLTRNS